MFNKSLFFWVKRATTFLARMICLHHASNGNLLKDLSRKSRRQPKAIYENAFNDIISTIEKEQNFKKVSDFDIRTGIPESRSLVSGSRFKQIQLFPGYDIFDQTDSVN